MSYQKKYVPDSLNKKDKKKAVKELDKSKKLYKKKQYYIRKKIKGFKSKKSSHVEKAKELYKVDKINTGKELVSKTKCSKKGLTQIIKKGMGAYYSSGSRPNQTPHSWGVARLASAITGGPSSIVDFHILEKECQPNSKALQLAKKNIKKGGGKKQKRLKNKKIIFKDYPDFTPNLTPREMFKLGSFGGTYWRPIYSSVTKQNYKNQHKKYPKSWWKDIPENHLSSSKCDITKNKYKVRVGTSLDFWESKGWITKYHPYGWVQWYCDFFMGKRSPDDERQISRWKRLAGKKGRFLRFLVTLCLKKNKKWNDETVSPKIRQTLQHWAYKLTKQDFDYEVNRRKSK